jgi:tetratricopeptide (TPR) repeat protein
LTTPQVEVQPLPRYQPIEPQASNIPNYNPDMPAVNPQAPPVVTTDPQSPPVTEPPTAPPVNQAPEGNQAVVALLDSAADYVAAQEWDKAGTALERALRIEPSNAGIWHDLAQIRLQQRNYEQASSLAAKSNSLARDNTFVQVRNWRLIAVARRALGDEAGADAAEAQALALEAR